MAKRWYVVHVFSGSEKKVCQNIELAEIDVIMNVVAQITKERGHASSVKKERKKWQKTIKECKDGFFYLQCIAEKDMKYIYNMNNL